MTKMRQAVDREQANLVQAIQHRGIEAFFEMIVEADFQSVSERSAGLLDPLEIRGSADDFIDDLCTARLEMPNRNSFRNRPMNLQDLDCGFPLCGDERPRVRQHFEQHLMSSQGYSAKHKIPDTRADYAIRPSHTRRASPQRGCQELP